MDVSSPAKKVKTLAEQGAYDEAYAVGKAALAANPADEGVREALRALTASLRTACMDLAVKKADYSADYKRKEALLRKANVLTGQDMYGRRA